MAHGQQEEYESRGGKAEEHRQTFQAWLHRHVLDTADYAEFARVLGETQAATGAEGTEAP